MAHCILIMGVSGCGKSTIGKLLADKLNLPFLEGDNFHPESNLLKMKSGQSLNDTDRHPWLENLAKAAEKNENTGFVMACSALKESYRKTLKTLITAELKIIFLNGDFDLIKKRMENRKGHFMPSTLLKSQLEALEKPKNALAIDISVSQEKIINSILKKIEKADFGIIGLGVMGKSLARNFAAKGIRTAVYNLPFHNETQIVENFVEKFAHLNFLPGKNLPDFIQKLKVPRTILLMIKSGSPVDEMIEKLSLHLEKGDVLIDAGNSFFKDTIRRSEKLKAAGIEFVGMGVSGGEEGALNGPSMMPAGSAFAKKRLMPMLKKTAAVADEKSCVEWMGEDGAGHFIKMVHNGIEYADMQLLSEVYAIGKNVFNLKNDKISKILKEWKLTPHNSYLLETTIDILRFRENDKFLLEEILDVAGHKGTGLWTVREALDLGVPIPTISAAMNERILSGKKALRERLSTPSSKKQQMKSESSKYFRGLKETFLFARLIALAEGFDLIKTASEKYDWKINRTKVAQIWRGGCIIRSDMLRLTIKAFETEPDLPHLFASKFFIDFFKNNENLISDCVSKISKTQTATPALSAAISYYKSMSTGYLPINLIQAQRDYFGAHTYRKISNQTQAFHTDWKKKKD